jgi:hypothetical protein
MRKEYYAHTVLLDTLRGKQVIEVTTKGDWMYALSGDKYRLPPRVASRVNRALRSGLVVRIVGRRIVGA